MEHGATLCPAPWTPPNPRPRFRNTPRLVLRQLTENDAEQLMNCWISSREHLLPWFPFADKVKQTKEACCSHIEGISADYESDPPKLNAPLYCFGIFELQSGDFVGEIVYQNLRAAGGGTVNLGYWIRADRSGRGYATEATRHMLSWAFEQQAAGGWGFRRVVIGCYEANIASRRVPEKLCLRLEGRARDCAWVDGHGFVDDLAFAVLVQEWDTAKHQLVHTPEPQVSTGS